MIRPGQSTVIRPAPTVRQLTAPHRSRNPILSAPGMYDILGAIGLTLGVCGWLYIAWLMIVG